jgi:hypothetical protein
MDAVVANMVSFFLYSMDKARKLGWNGFVDSTQSIQDTMHDFVDLKMIPPVSFPRPR